MRDVGLSFVLILRRSPDEARALFRRDDHLDFEGARVWRVGARPILPLRHCREHDLPLKVEVRQHGGFRNQATA